MPPKTIRELIVWAGNRLKAAGTATPVLDARLLVQDVSGLSREQLITQDQMALGAAQLAKLQTLVERRENGEPIAYILGQKSFWKHTFKVGPGVLVPRPETETLVMECLTHANRRPVRTVLDLGTGSGCIIISVLAERGDIVGYGVDRSMDALFYARVNAARLGVSERCHFVCADWAAPIAGGFDIIVANPPYLTTAEWQTACRQGPLGHEPRAALDGGGAGIGPYGTIARQAASRLNPGGVLLFEIGSTQAPPIEQILVDQGFARVATLTDIAGLPRTVRGYKSDEQGG